jgi:hypothetical protein
LTFKSEVKNYADWPVAQDDRGALIPFELLDVEKDQPLIYCGHLRPVLFDRLRQYLKEGGEYRIRSAALIIFKRIAWAQLRSVSSCCFCFFNRH